MFDRAGRLTAHCSESCAITAMGNGDTERRDECCRKRDLNGEPEGSMRY